jgi:N-methylhydantoinase A/oxoprolinase/acetone carboxylase beta subunit
MIGDEVVCSAKRLTTRDVGDGVIAAVLAALESAKLSPSALASVMVGTTQFINAFVQRRNLSPVASVRVSLPKTDGIPPMVGWPADLVEVIGKHSYLVGGGSFYDGKLYAELDVSGLEAAARDIVARGIRSIAVTSNFAPVRPDVDSHAWLQRCQGDVLSIRFNITRPS